MCGRFVRAISLPELLKEFDVEEPPFDVQPSYNVAPSQEIVIIVNDGKKMLALCRWGFVPSWSKDTAIGNKMINARAESVAEKPSFKSAFKSKRILVVADGFYEWRKDGKVKTPVYVHLKSGRPFGLAGLFNIWTSPEGKKMCTSTIITTSANKLLGQIHSRMPVIINKADEELWLNSSVHDAEGLNHLMIPYKSEEMAYYEVSSLVNSPSNNSPDCIIPLNKKSRGKT
jgi:putative SOS response-associated peptidase YedK